MKSRRWLITSFVALACLCAASQALAQSPGALYTWDNTGNAMPNIEAWIKGFGPNSVLLDNAIAGELRVIETGGVGASVAISDGFNRIRESLTSGSGGTDLTGLDYLEFDLGHTGAGNINVQFYVQASTGGNFVALGPDLAVTPGVNTYQVPLTGLTPAQAVYVRTMGFNARDHAVEGDVVWTLRELRSGGTPLQARDLITHSTGGPEGGLQGAYVNFDGAGVLGNTGQNQTGLSHNASGPGSLQWTDVGGGPGGAIEWGNGTALNGNTFNNREADLSNYDYMIIRMSATDPLNGGGTVGFGPYFHTNNFAFQGAGAANLPIDGKFHSLKFPLAGLVNMNGVDGTAINMFGHAQNLIMNVDRIRFIAVPEPATASLMVLALIGCAGIVRRGSRRM